MDQAADGDDPGDVGGLAAAALEHDWDRAALEIYAVVKVLCPANGALQPLVGGAAGGAQVPGPYREAAAVGDGLLRRRILIHSTADWPFTRTSAETTCSSV